MDPNRSIRLRWVQTVLSDSSHQLTRFHFSQHALHPWEPAINAYRCEDAIRICVDLAGVERSSIDLRIEPRRLVLRGTRDVPEPADSGKCILKTIAMEIDYGPFMRVIPLPGDAEVEIDEAEAVQENGFLWIHLPFKKP